VTHEPLFKSVVDDTLGYLLREMYHSEGGFYSTQDADSEGEEGKFFVWTAEDVSRLLSEDDGEIFSRIFDVSEQGNFDDKNILHPILTLEQASKFFRKSPPEIENLIIKAKQKLFTDRESRIKPFRDEKIIAGWNGLMLSGLAEAIKISPRTEYIEAAARTVNFLFAKMYRDGLLLHSYKNGQAKVFGFLDDYAYLALGLLDLYEALLDPELLENSRKLAGIMLAEFWDGKDGGFFYTGKSHERLISRAKPVFDASVPSGNAMATQLLLRLYHMTGNDDYRQRAEKVLRSYYDAMESQPFGFAHMLCALDFYLSQPQEVVVVGALQDPATRELLAMIHSRYLPNLTLQLVSGDHREANPSPILEGKVQIQGKPTVYVCQNFTCSAPATNIQELESLLFH
jgi:uncharacterized protein YyaL (SSP411 family)